MKRLFVGASAPALVLALACGSAHAAAQAGAPPGGPVVAPSTSADATNNVAGTNVIQEVVVTATKRATNLQTTPIAITAFSQAQLNENKIRDVTSLAAFVPSLEFAQQGDQSAILLTLRGIGNDSAFTEVADPEVAIYVDGIYSARAQGASVLLYDLDRVEVLRGPQGTLFGRNATVGAVSLVTAKPTFDSFHGNAEIVAGDYNRFGSRFTVNIPISDTLAARLAFISERHDGYIDYQPAPQVAGVNQAVYVTNGPKYYSGDERSGRLSLRWKPDNKFEWNINGELFKDNGNPILQLPQEGFQKAGQPFWSAQIDTAPEQDRYAINIRSQMDYQFNEDYAVSYIAGAGRIGGSTTVDSDAGIQPPTSPTTANGVVTSPQGAFDQNETVYSRYDSYSHELQLKSPGHHFIDWIIGGYYTHETNAIRFDVDIRDGYKLGAENFTGSFIQADRSIESKAAFSQATLNATSWLHLTGGLRYTDDTKQDVGGRNVTFGGCPNGVPPAGATQVSCNGLFGRDQSFTAAELVAELPGFSISNNDTKGSWDKLTYLARVDADLTRNLFGYVSVSSGFKSGNIEDGGLLANPETLTNYEVGLKWKLLGGRATLNSAFYYEDFKGFQINQVNNVRDANNNVIASQIVTKNAQGAQAYGLEVELQANLTSQDRVQAAFSFQNTELDHLLDVDQRFFNVADLTHQVDLKGNELPHAPHAFGTISYEHDFPLADGARITPRATVHFESKSYESIFNAGEPDSQSAYTRSDFAVRYQPLGNKWLAEVFVQNLEDAKIRDSSGGRSPTQPIFTSNYQPPRTYGGRVSVNF